MESPLPANSRVTVLCTDPSGVFSTFEPLLAQRLPLRNLYWKSPTRPLRAINSLHVALEQAKYGQTEAQPSERRHQIPGLRQTPYLKTYLLRCDDKEIYKSICRKQIREWIRNETGSLDNKSSNSQEGHDAFEYLIVHVVLPNTPAASEPRVSRTIALENASFGPADSTDSINSNSKSKWPGKGSSTVYDKIRADFNGSSKTGLERVAQVRIIRNEPSESIQSASLGPSEIEEQWQDLVEKLKVSILSSFDRRVRQYEADIRERDSQRNLPGWNFCTFFILKEGLARGFESVGLLEDALLGYDELAVGLDVILREEAVQKDEDQTATFLPFSKDLKNKIRDVIEGTRTNGSTPANVAGSSTSDETLLRLDESLYPLDQQKKPYRELILSNDISTFDLRTYIFTRQEELLLRRANLSLDTTRATSGAGPTTGHVPQDELFLYLGQICQRGVAFVSLGAQTLRQELYRAWGGHNSTDLTHMNFQKSLIDNIVLSWVYCAALQILAQTSSPAVVIPTQPPFTAVSRFGNSFNRASPGSQLDGLTEPSHDTEEGHTSISTHELLSPDADSKGKLSSQQQLEAPLGQSDQGKLPKAGIENFASWRAELYMLARRNLGALRREHDRLPDINHVGKVFTRSSSANFEEVCLDYEKAKRGASSSTETSASTTLGLEPQIVEQAARSREVFTKLYEQLTKQAYGHFLRAGNLKSATRTLVDIALLKYQQKDYDSAATCFEHICDDKLTAMWDSLDGTILELYADCLKRLKLVPKYLRVILRILAMYAAYTQSEDRLSSSTQAVQALIEDLTSISADLNDQIVVPMDEFFKVASSELCISHYRGQDGFYVTLPIYNLLGPTIDIPNGAKMVLTALDGSQAVLELRTHDSIQLQAIPMDMILESNVTTSGWYEPRRLEMVLGNIIFLQEFGANKAVQPLRYGTSSASPSAVWKPVFVYPAVHALQAKAKPPNKIHLPQPRSMLIELSSGWNNIRACTMRLKAATAGLRLQVRKAVLFDSTVSEHVKLLEGADNQSVSFSDFSADNLLTIFVPYTLESADTTSLVARLEIVYVTEHGSYTYVDMLSINTILPIKVNVEDIFQESSKSSSVKIALISRLTISPATLVPLRVESCEIAGSEAFHVEPGVGHAFPMDVFPDQPASLVYRFTRHQRFVPAVKEKPLAVSIRFRCLDQEVLSTIENQFLTDIANSSCATLARPLTAHLLTILRSQWTQNDLEVACLLQEVRVWSYEEIGWDAICGGLRKEAAYDAKQWLQNWHRGHQSISLAHTEATQRQISIPVEIPAPRILLTVNLALTTNGDRHRLAIGQPLTAILKIRHSGGWEEGSSVMQPNKIEFSYEVIASPETWIVGGRRRGHFNVDVAEQQAFPVLLIPQRTGHLLLPSVEIKCTTPDGDNSRTVAPNGLIAFEVNYKSHAKSVLVIPDLHETTISLDMESAGGRSLLVNSQRRQMER